MITFTTRTGNVLTIFEDGYLSIKTKYGNSFSGYIKDGKVTGTTTFGRMILERSYSEFMQNINTKEC